MAALTAAPVGAPALHPHDQPVQRGTRQVAAEVNPREQEWHAIAARALRGDLPLWVVLGDSIAQGVGSSTLSRSWVAGGGGPRRRRPSARRRQPEPEWCPGPACARRAAPLLDHLDREPALITCGVGSNDLMRNPHPPSVSARVNELIDVPFTSTIVSTLPAPPASPSGRWVNRSVRRTAERQGLGVADVVPHLVGPCGGWAPDRFHPNDAGYHAWVVAHCLALDLDPEAVPDAWDPHDLDTPPPLPLPLSRGGAVRKRGTGEYGRAMDNVTLEHHDDLAVIRIDDGKANALGHETIGAINAAMTTPPRRRRCAVRAGRQVQCRVRSRSHGAGTGERPGSGAQRG
ncbi:MAG: GDSL-type esterase/lipase family protein [Acidimicrobiales bacterium]